MLPSELNGDGAALVAADQDLDEVTKQAIAFASDVVFCHNDALSGNILYNDSWDRVQIIDYEYGVHACLYACLRARLYVCLLACLYACLLACVLT